MGIIDFLSRLHRVEGMHFKLTWKPLFSKLACGNYESARHLGSKRGRELLKSGPLRPKTPRRGWVVAEKLSSDLSCCSQQRIEKGMIANFGLKASC